MEKKNSKKILIGAIVLAVLVAVFAGVYFKFGAKATAGAKAIEIEVVNSQGESTKYDFNTDAEYLKDAMDELAEADDFSYSGTDSEYGIMIEVVNGEQAIFAEDGAYWALYVNGDYGQYGADQQPVADADVYTWKYEKAE